MKIGFFYTGYYPVTSSGSVHGYQLFRALRRRGHTILSCMGENNPECINYPPTKLGALKLARDSDILYIRENISYLDQRITFLKFANPFSLPVVWEINSPVNLIYSLCPDKKEAAKKIKKETMRLKFFSRFVDAACCVSKEVQQYAKNVLGIKKSFFIPNGSNPELFNPRQQLQENILDGYKDYFKVGWIGRADRPWAGVNIALRVAERCYERDQRILFVFIAHRGTFEFPELENILVIDEVIYNNLPSYLLKLDVCLCLYETYSWEGFGFFLSPLKLYDYMAAAKPVIATGIGQIKEVIRDQENGLLTDNNIDDITQKILQLKNDSNLRKKLGEQARKDVVRYYNWHRVAEQTENVFKSLGCPV